MLNSVYVVPGFTFFYWGFSLPKKEYPSYTKHFKLSKRKGLVRDIRIEIGNKKYPAKIRLARIRTSKFPNRDVVQIFYDREYNTLKALRKLFVYSYAATINKSKSNIKEVLELIHVRDDIFKVKVVAKQKTDFDSMFEFLEDKNLFEYWKNARQGKERSLFIDYSRGWLPVKDLEKYANRVNVVYLLYHSKLKQLYVGKANRFGDRVKSGVGRVGLPDDWDKFMFFEIDPDYSPFIEQIEAFAIRSFSALVENKVGIEPLKGSKVELVNRQLIRKR